MTPAFIDFRWREAFSVVKAFRRSLKQTDGIKVSKEFHATDFVTGRGNLGSQVVPKGRRAAILKEALRMTASLPNVGLFNGIAFSNKQEALLFEWLLNRISRTLTRRETRHYAVLFCDQGKEQDYTKLTRRMSVHNPIPSRLDSGPEVRLKGPPTPAGRFDPKLRCPRAQEDDPALQADTHQTR